MSDNERDEEDVGEIVDSFEPPEQPLPYYNCHDPLGLSECMSPTEPGELSHNSYHTHNLQNFKTCQRWEEWCELKQEESEKQQCDCSEHSTERCCTEPLPEFERVEVRSPAFSEPPLSSRFSYYRKSVQLSDAQEHWALLHETLYLNSTLHFQRLGLQPEELECFDFLEQLESFLCVPSFSDSDDCEYSRDSGLERSAVSDCNELLRYAQDDMDWIDDVRSEHFECTGECSTDQEHSYLEDSPDFECFTKFDTVVLSERCNPDTLSSKRYYSSDSYESCSCFDRPDRLKYSNRSKYLEDVEPYVKPDFNTSPISECCDRNESASDTTKWSAKQDDIPGSCNLYDNLTFCVLGEVPESDVVTEYLVKFENDVHENCLDRVYENYTFEGCVVDVIDNVTLGLEINALDVEKPENCNFFTLYNEHNRDLQTEPLRVDVFVEHYDKERKIVCAKCRMAVLSSGFAMHLEVCMGVKQSRTRTPRRVRIITNTNGHDSSIYEEKLPSSEDDDDADADWSTSGEKRKRKRDRNGTKRIRGTPIAKTESEFTGLMGTEVNGHDTYEHNRDDESHNVFNIDDFLWDDVSHSYHAGSRSTHNRGVVEIKAEKIEQNLPTPNLLI